MDFTLKERDYARDQGPSEERARTGGVQGAQINPDLSIPPIQADQSASVLNGLMKAAERVVAPMIQKAEEAQFIEGMSRAAAGEAAKDIAAERPAWSNVFGEGAAVLGARAYEGKADAAAFEQKASEHLRVSKALPPLEYAQLLHTTLAESLTGDPIRDQQIKANALASMPLHMKQHAKEHLAYNQRKAWNTRGNAMEAELGALQATMGSVREGNAPVTADDLQLIRNRFAAAMEPFPGEDVDLRNRQLTAVFSNAIAAGNFDSVNFLKETGAWDSLVLTDRDTLQRQYNTEAARRLPGLVSTGLIDAYAAIGKGSIEWSGEKIDAEIDRINAAARAETGVDYDLIPGSKRAALREAEEAKVKAATGKAETASKAANKEAQKELDRMNREAMFERVLTSTAVLQGAVPPGTSAHVRAVTENGAEAERMVAARLWDNLQDPAARAAVAANLGEGNPWPQLKDQVNQVVGSEAWSPLVDQARKTLRALPAGADGSSGLRAVYANKSEEELFLAYEANLAAGMPPPDAWGQAKTARRLAPYQNPPAHTEEIRKGIAAAVKDDLTSWIGTNTATPAGLVFANSIALANYNNAPGHGKDRYRNALAMAKQRLGFLPAVTYMKADGVGELHSYFTDNGKPRPKSELNSVVAEHLKTLGISSKDVPIMELVEMAPGKVALRGQYTPPDGGVIGIVITHDMFRKGIDKLHAPKQADPTTMVDMDPDLNPYP